MSSTIQWCDGPIPSVKRPSHTAWVESTCWAMATGWRVWIGTTAVPTSMRSVAPPMSAAAVRASKSFGIWGTQSDVKPAASAARASATSRAHLLAVPAPLGADHQPDPHLRTSRRRSTRQWRSRFARTSLAVPFDRVVNTHGDVRRGEGAWDGWQS